jgi:hypothetical protein
MKRLLLLVLAVGVVWYLVKSYGLFSPASGGAAAGTANPIDRARAAAGASDARTSAGEAAGREADAPAGGAVSENMTPDQVRALLGPPDDISTETLGSGVTRETWTYRSVGKSVVFENGVVAQVR